MCVLRRSVLRRPTHFWVIAGTRCVAEGLCQAVVVVEEPEPSSAGRRSDHRIVRRSTSILTSLVRPGEELATAIDGVVVVELRGTALELWRLTVEEIRIDALIEQLADSYGVEPAAIASDVLDAVDRLMADGLLEPVWV